MMGVEPVDDALVMHSQLPAYCSKAHPFQAQAQGLLSEGSIVAVRFGVGCEVPLARLTPEPLAAASVETCFLHSAVTVTVGAWGSFHNIYFTTPLLSSSLPSAGLEAAGGAHSKARRNSASRPINKFVISWYYLAV